VAKKFSLSVANGAGKPHQTIAGTVHLLVRLENVPWMQGERDGDGQCGQVIPFRVPDEWQRQKKREHLRSIWEIN
jgi:hypothetical protein